jgi:hypothetical protein
VTIGILLLTLIAADPAAARKEPSMAEQPYRIRLWLNLEKHPRFTSATQANLQYETARLSNRLLGRAWNLEMSAPPAGLMLDPPPATEALKSHLAGKDKLIWIEADARPRESSRDWTRIPVLAREYDVELNQWGPPLHDELRGGASFASDLFLLAFRVFRPTAMIPKPSSALTVDAIVRGLALAPDDGAFPLAAVGSPFHVYREFYDKEKFVSRSDVSWTYLTFAKRMTGGFAGQFEVDSGLRNPLGQRTRKKSRLVAIATGEIKNGVTTVRFVTGKDQRPVAGLQVLARPQGSGSTIALGNTDHRGEIDVRPVRLSTETAAPSGPRLVQVTLIAGRNPLASFPLLPGDPDRLTVRVTVDPFLTELNGRILALQEEVVDTVAKRTLNLKRLETLAAKKDLVAAKKTVDEINQLPGRAVFDEKLAKIKALAEERRKESKRPTLGFAVQRMFNQTDYMLGEHFKADKVSINFDVDEKADAKPSP